MTTNEQLAAQQDQRTTSALRERDGWRWGRTPDRRYICETGEGRCYVVTRDACSCPDHEHRCKGTELRCKHRVALGHALLEAGRLP